MFMGRGVYEAGPEKSSQLSECGLPEQDLTLWRAGGVNPPVVLPGGSHPPLARGYRGVHTPRSPADTGGFTPPARLHPEAHPGWAFFHFLGVDSFLHIEVNFAPHLELPL